VVWASIVHPKLDVTEVMQVAVPVRVLPVLPFLQAPFLQADSELCCGCRLVTLFQALDWLILGGMYS
jgi:hypothetical protein